MSLFKIVGLIVSLSGCVGWDQGSSLNVVMHSGIGGKSHIKGALEMGELLIKRGHRVEYVAFEDSLKFAKGYNISTYALGSALFEPNFIQKHIMGASSEPEKKQPTMMSPILIKVMKESYIRTFSPLESYLERKKPDLIVCDFSVEACTDLAKKKGIPLIVYIQSTHTLGLVTAPYITRQMEYGSLTIENMTFKERFFSAIIEPLPNAFQFIPFLKYKSELKKKYNVPKSFTIFPGADYGVGIANTFTGFEVAGPSQPNIFQVGPILSPHPEQLTLELSRFLNNHPRTILIAFGSNIKLSTSEAIKLIQAGLMSLKRGAIDGLIWGLGLTYIDDFPKNIEVDGTTITISDLFDGKYEGIKLLKWAPQQAILNHPNTKLFISHCGLESSFESINSATPILCIPYFGDQLRNAAKLERFGVGYYINRHQSTAADITSLISRIIRDKSGLIQVYLDRAKVIVTYNAKRVHSAIDIIENQAYSAKACRPGLPYNPNDNLPPCESSHLISADIRMGWFKSNLIDVYIIAIASLLLVVVSLICIILQMLMTIRKSINRNAITQFKAKII